MSDEHPQADAYKNAGVDIAEADAGLRNIVRRITATWPQGGPGAGFGAVQLPIGYFANVIDIGGIGLGICTDGVGSKAIVAEMMHKYDTIGIDCIAMNVNDLLCVGATPLSLVDYIAVERADAAMLDGIAAGLAEGARQPGSRSRAARSRSCAMSSAVSIWSERRSERCGSTGSSSEMACAPATG